MLHVLSRTLMHSHRCSFETACVSTITYIQAVRKHGVIKYTCRYSLVELKLDMPTLLLQGHTPLIFASIGGHEQIVQMLLSHHADPLPSNGHVSPTLPEH